MKKKKIVISDNNLAYDLSTYYVLRGQKKDTLLGKYLRASAHDSINLTNLRINLLDIASNAGISLTNIQKLFLDNWQRSKLSYLSYIQRRMMGAGSFLFDPLARVANVTALNTELVANDKAALQYSIDAVYSGSKSFVGATNTLTVELFEVFKSLSKIYDKLSDETKGEIEGILKRWTDTGMMSIEVSPAQLNNSSGSFATVTAPFFSYVKTLGQELKNVISRGDNPNLSSNRMGSSSIAARTAMQAFNVSAERVSIMMDDETILTGDIKVKMVEKAANYKNYDGVRSLLGSHLDSIFTSDVPLLSSEIVRINMRDFPIIPGQYDIPIGRRAQLVPLDLYSMFVAYWLLLGAHKNSKFTSFFEAELTEYSQEEGGISVQAKNGESMLSRVYTRHKDFFDDRSDSRTVISTKAIDSGLVLLFRTIKGAVRSTATTFDKVNQTKIKDIVYNKDPHTPMFPMAVSVDKDGRLAFSYNPFYSLQLFYVSVLRGLSIDTKNGNKDIQDTGYANTDFLAGKIDLQRSQPDVSKALSELYLATDNAISELFAGSLFNGEYDMKEFERVRSAFRTLLSSLENVTTSDAALVLIASFKDQADSWKGTLSAKLYSAAQLAKTNGLESPKEAVDDSGMDDIAYIYRRIISPVSCYNPSVTYRAEYPIRKKLALRDVLLEKDRSSILSKGNSLNPHFRSGTDDIADLAFHLRQLTMLATEMHESDLKRKISNIKDIPLFKALLQLNTFKAVHNFHSYGKIAANYSDLRLIDKFTLPSVVRDQSLLQLREIEDAMIVHYSVYAASVQQMLSANLLASIQPLITVLSGISATAPYLSDFSSESREFFSQSYKEIRGNILDMFKDKPVDVLALSLIEGEFIAFDNGMKSAGNLSTAKIVKVPVLNELDQTLDLALTSSELNSGNALSYTVVRSLVKYTEDALVSVRYRTGLPSIEAFYLNEFSELFVRDKKRISTEPSERPNSMIVPSEAVYSRYVYRAFEEEEELLGRIGLFDYSSEVALKVDYENNSFKAESLNDSSKAKRILGDEVDIDSELIEKSGSNKGLFDAVKNVVELIFNIKESSSGTEVMSIPNYDLQELALFPSVYNYSAREFSANSLSIAESNTVIEGPSMDSIKRKVGDLLGIGCESKMGDRITKFAARAVANYVALYGDEGLIKASPLLGSVLAEKNSESRSIGDLYELNSKYILSEGLSYQMVCYYHGKAIEPLLYPPSVVARTDEFIGIALGFPTGSGIQIDRNLNDLSLVLAYRDVVERTSSLRSLPLSVMRKSDVDVALTVIKEVTQLFDAEVDNNNKNKEENETSSAE